MYISADCDNCNRLQQNAPLLLRDNFFLILFEQQI